MTNNKIKLDPSKLHWDEVKVTSKQFDDYREHTSKQYLYGSLVLMEIVPSYNCSPQLYSVYDSTSRFAEPHLFTNEADAMKYCEKITAIRDTNGHFREDIEIFG